MLSFRRILKKTENKLLYLKENNDIQGSYKYMFQKIYTVLFVTAIRALAKSSG